MILYEKRFGAFNLLIRLYGSQWPRAFILAIPGTLLAALVKAFVRPQLEQGIFFLHPYPCVYNLCHLFNNSFIRFLARYVAFYKSHLSKTGGFILERIFLLLKCLDSVYATILAFIILFRTNLSYQRYWEGRTMVSQMSEKWSGATIEALSFDEAAKEPGIPGGALFRAQFVHTMSLMHAVAIQRLRGDSDVSNLSKASFFERCVPPPVDPVQSNDWVKLRAKKSYLILRAKQHHYENYWSTLPLPVLGGMNETEQSIVLGEGSPVYVVYCWIHRMIVERREKGGIREDPSIVSRIFSLLSEGMLGYENAKKIVDTPFPFPYAQCCALLLHINSLGLPLLMANYIGSIWLTGVVTFVSLFAYYLINEVAREIEEPFKCDPNDIPVTNLHYKFNNDLITGFVKGLIPEKGLFSHIPDKSLQLDVVKARPVTIADNKTLKHASSKPLRSDSVESKKDPPRRPRTAQMAEAANRSQSPMKSRVK